MRIHASRWVARALAAATCCLSAPAAATWSIVAVDPGTLEVGAAAATCTVGIEYTLGLVPGRGVIVAQANPHFPGRDRGVDLLRLRTAPEEVLEAIANPDYDPPRPWGSFRERQYAIAAFEGDPPTASYTGEATQGWSGARSHGFVSAQGNLLRGAAVVDAALAAFDAPEGRRDECATDLSERLMRALEAGAAAGGDVRCDPQRAALTAYVAIARPDDDRTTPTLFAVAPRRFGPVEVVWHQVFDWKPEPESPPAVVALRERYEEWRRRNRDALCGS